MNPVATNYLHAALTGIFTLGILFLMMPWIKTTSRWRPVPILIAIAVTLNYLIWRATSTIPSITKPLDFITGMAFLLIEGAAVVGTLLSFVSLLKTKSRTGEANANLNWYGEADRAPLVDVLICTYNEDEAILERTITGAMAMDYPNFRVWVLDDGKREWLADLTKELGGHYLTRTDNDHAKAGNINNALRHLNGLDQRPTFVSVLDADFVPARNFLSRTVSLFHDNTVGIVQTPQHFINPDPIQMNLKTTDIWPDEQRYFFDTLMASKDAWGTAFCCGTSSVLRMDALEKAGWFPTDSVTEDYLVTIRLKQLGFKTVYLNEPLSLGLAPEGIVEYVTQRSRWCLGFIQIIKSQFGPFQPNNGLSFSDRVSLIESTFYWTGAYMFRAACFLIPILYLAFGIKALDVVVEEALSYFLPYYLINVTVVAWVSRKTVLPIMNDIGQLIAAKEILMANLVGYFGEKDQKFKVTGKGGDRSKMIIHWDRIRLFGAIITVNMLAIAWSFLIKDTQTNTSADGAVLFWSWYNILVLSIACYCCIERPRFRKSERMAANFALKVTANGQTSTVPVVDVSTGGMMFAGNHTMKVGDEVTVSLEGKELPAKVVRASANDFSISMHDNDDTRRSMIRFVYSGIMHHPKEDIRTHVVAGRVIRRMIA